MGKNSLLAPTAKKKPKKNSAPKTGSAKKTAPKKKPAAAKASSPAKPAQKRGANAAPKAKKPSLKELVFKKFHREPPGVVYSPPSPEGGNAHAAPPLITGDAEEVKRIKAVLFRKFDMADVKAAAEKAAAETAAAEKASAEKAAAENAAAGMKKKREKEPPDVQDRMMKIAMAVFAVLVFAVIGVSFSHKNTYYLESKDGGVEVWQGKFAPMGKTLLLALPGARLPENMNAAGPRDKIFPFVVNYYIEQADLLLETSDVPDFIGIQSSLNKAAPYAVTPRLQKDISVRSVTISLMTLLYKSEVAAAAETAAGYDRAMAFLSDAKALDLDPLQAELVEKKLASLQQRVEGSRAFVTEDPKMLPEAEPAEKEPGDSLH